MNVLAIGNSFSQDATRYLSNIALAQGKHWSVVNLFIPGCPLERHFRNMLSGERAYSLEFNGQSTGFYVSLDEALLSRSWDVITIQQASPSSAKKRTYQPYLHELVLHIRKYCPQAKLYLHETWAYDQSFHLLGEWYGKGTAEDMYKDVVRCYREAAKEEAFDGLIPSGELIHALLENGVSKIHRDGFHLSYGLGRYAVGLLWLRMLTGVSVAENTFSCFDESVSENEIALAKKLVDGFAPLI